MVLARSRGGEKEEVLTGPFLISSAKRWKKEKVVRWGVGVRSGPHRGS